jgi:hypothetical protein
LGVICLHGQHNLISDRYTLIYHITCESLHDAHQSHFVLLSTRQTATKSSNFFLPIMLTNYRSAHSAPKDEADPFGLPNE